MNILLINAQKAFGHSAGRLNTTLHETARDTLAELGHALEETELENGYDIDQEVAKYLWADLVIYQQPGWWMGAPWTLKRYLDEVLTQGHGKLYASDGRTSADPSRNYGRGGLLQGTSYMLSVTWNAPLEAFNDPTEFFEGRGVDAVYFPFHKSQEFLGMSAQPTFMVNDVMKNPQIEQYITRYREHLTRHIGAA